MSCEKFAKNCPKIAKIWSKIDLKIALLAQTGIVIEFLIGFNSLLELYLPDWNSDANTQTIKNAL